MTIYTAPKELNKSYAVEKTFSDKKESKSLYYLTRILSLREEILHTLYKTLPSTMGKNKKDLNNFVETGVIMEIMGIVEVCIHLATNPIWDTPLHI